MISIEELNSQLKEYKQTKEEQQRKGNKDFVKCSFLPEGEHEGRFLVDPLSKLHESFTAFGFFNKGVRAINSLPHEEKMKAPDEWRENDPLYELYYMEDGLKDNMVWKCSPKPVFLVYFYLLKTNAPSENWVPGTLYCIIGDRKLEEAFMKMTATLANSGSVQEIQNTLSHDKKGVLLSVEYSRGSQGRCVVGPKFPAEYVEVDMTGQVYEPLESAYIRPVFDKEKYDALIQANAELLEEARERRGKKKEEWEAKKKREGIDSDSETEEEYNEEQESNEESNEVSSPEPAAASESTSSTTQTEPEVKKEEKPVKEDPLAKYRIKQ